MRAHAACVRAHRDAQVFCEPRSRDRALELLRSVDEVGVTEELLSFGRAVARRMGLPVRGGDLANFTRNAEQASAPHGPADPAACANVARARAL